MSEVMENAAEKQEETKAEKFIRLGEYRILLTMRPLDEHGTWAAKSKKE